MNSSLNQEFTDGDVIWYLCGTRVYQVLIDALNARGVHGKGVMAVFFEHFHSLAIELARKVSGTNRILHTVC